MTKIIESTRIRGRHDCAEVDVLMNAGGVPVVWLCSTPCLHDGGVDFDPDDARRVAAALNMAAYRVDEMRRDQE